MPKNLFVYAALVFVGKLFDLRALGKVTLAFLLFSLVAGSVYLLNDLLDIESDRAHPEKRRRPIASGKLPTSLAWLELFLFGVGGITAGFLLKPAFGLTLLAYLILQITYCFSLKHIVLLDVFTIALGFVLRTVAGGAVLSVHVSHWLLLCTLLLALFLGFGKRRQELVLMGGKAGQSRAILKEYSLAYLDQMINIVSGATIVCYSVYSIESETAKSHPHLWITVPFVIFGVFRYMYLVYQKGWGGAPDEVLLKDRTLQIDIALWLVAALVLLKFDTATLSIFGQ